MKDHKYPPELIAGIRKDPEYFILFFNRLAAMRKDPHYAPKIRKNGDMTMKCPIHLHSGRPKNRKPSMRLNVKTNIVKCFSCGLSADIFTIVMRYNLMHDHGVSFLQAVGMILGMKKHPRTFPIFTGKGQINIDFPERKIPSHFDDDYFPF